MKKWSHLAIEGHCLNMSKNFQNTPCLMSSPGAISLLCLGQGKAKCDYFGFCGARSTLTLTDADGQVIKANSFFLEESISNDQWIAREKEWLENCSTLIDSV